MFVHLRSGTKSSSNASWLTLTIFTGTTSFLVIKISIFNRSYVAKIQILHSLVDLKTGSMHGKIHWLAYPVAIVNF